jgi:hypothetical protein
MGKPKSCSSRGTVERTGNVLRIALAARLRKEIQKEGVGSSEMLA